MYSTGEFRGGAGRKIKIYKKGAMFVILRKIYTTTRLKELLCSFFTAKKKTTFDFYRLTNTSIMWLDRRNVHIMTGWLLGENNGWRRRRRRQAMSMLQYFVDYFIDSMKLFFYLLSTPRNRRRSKKLRSSNMLKINKSSTLFCRFFPFIYSQFGWNQ